MHTLGVPLSRPCHAMPKETETKLVGMVWYGHTRRESQIKCGKSTKYELQLSNKPGRKIQTTFPFTNLFILWERRTARRMVRHDTRQQQGPLPSSLIGAQLT